MNKSPRLSKPTPPNHVSANMKNHPIADSVLRGPDKKWALATVLRGPFMGETVSIMVEYLDGWCICDFGIGPGQEKEPPMEIIHIDDLRLWTKVESVNTRKPVRKFGQLGRRLRLTVKEKGWRS